MTLEEIIEYNEMAKAYKDAPTSDEAIKVLDHYNKKTQLKVIDSLIESMSESGYKELTLRDIERAKQQVIKTIKELKP